MGTCFECDSNFDLDEDTEIGDTITCPKCGIKYEVLNTSPVTLDYSDEQDEDQA